MAHQFPKGFDGVVADGLQYARWAKGNGYPYCFVDTLTVVRTPPPCKSTSFHTSPPSLPSTEPTPAWARGASPLFPHE